MFDYFSYDLNSIYTRGISWGVIYYCKSEKVSLEYLLYTLRNLKK